jgi:hypothetical protein
MEPVISLNALKELLREAIKAVPAVRYALGVASIATAAAIVLAIFQQRAEIAVIGTAVMIAFMVVLLVFATLSRMSVGFIQYPAIILLWVTVICFCLLISLLTTSFFFSWPVNFFDLWSKQTDQLSWQSVPGIKPDTGLDKVRSSNLPAAEELSALLSSTKPKRLLRIAVPNIAAQPADQEPRANAIKELILVYLKTKSIVVSDEEIVALNTAIAERGIDKMDVSEFADFAKKAAADVVLKMKMFQVGASQYIFSATPIVVAERKASSFSISAAENTVLFTLATNSARGLMSTPMACRPVTKASTSVVPPPT